MTDEPNGAVTGAWPVSPDAQRALAALLAIDPETAARVRDRSPARRRPAPQYGPQLDLGESEP